MCNGSAACWGGNLYGNLGIGTTEAARGDGPGEMGDNLILTKLPTNTKVVAVAAGQKHVGHLLDNGKIACFGQNSYGQLGGTGDRRGTTVPARVPVSPWLGYWTESDQESESCTGKVFYYYVYFGE